ALVFDDYHEAGEEAALHRVVCAAVDEMPPGHRIFVVSRNVAPAPFSGLRARGQLTAIEARALDLSPAESRQLARRLHARARAGDIADRSQASCAGWMAGFLLLMQRVGEEGATGDRLPIEITEYFEHQV